MLLETLKKDIKLGRKCFLHEFQQGKACLSEELSYNLPCGWMDIENPAHVGTLKCLNQSHSWLNTCGMVFPITVNEIPPFFHAVFDAQLPFVFVDSHRQKCV